MRLDHDNGSLADKIRRFGRRFNNSLSETFEADAAYATEWMKTNAPWRDNTGAAGEPDRDGKQSWQSP